MIRLRLIQIAAIMSLMGLVGLLPQSGLLSLAVAEDDKSNDASATDSAAKKEEASTSGEYLIDGKPVKPVEPLDAWVRKKSLEKKVDRDVKASQSKTSDRAPKPLTEDLGGDEVQVSEADTEADEESIEESGILEQGKYFFDADPELLERLNSPVDSLQVIDEDAFIREKNLTKSQATRMRFARKRFLEILRNQEKWLEQRKQTDPRGPSEVTVCSINFTALGGRSEVNKILRRRGLRRYGQRKLDTIQAIVASRCNVVAVQSILGRDQIKASEGLEEFAEILTSKTLRAWNSIVGPSNHRFAFNGFLYDSRVKLVNTLSYEKVLLPKLKGFEKEEEFVRGPFEIEIEVPGRGTSGSKILKIITFHFSSSTSGVVREDMAYQVQMAEGVRQILGRVANRYSRTEHPVVMLAGYVDSPKSSIARQVLEGRIELADFAREGPCYSLLEKPHECSKIVHRSKQFFGLFSDYFDPIVRRLVVGEEGERQIILSSRQLEDLKEKRYKNWGYFSDILLSQSDLPLTRRNPVIAGHFATRAVDIPGFNPGNALMAVTLNW